jgi:hypothetical protein
MTLPGIALLAEIAQCLLRHRRLRVIPSIERASDDDGAFTLSLCFKNCTTNYDYALFELRQDLKHIVDVAQLRALASSLNIDEAQLEAMLQPRQSSSTPAELEPLTFEEMRAMYNALTDDHLLVDNDADELLINSGAEKLRMLLSDRIMS